MDAHKMAQKFHIRNQELKPNESLRSPCTGPSIKSSLPEEDKTSKLLNNFSICDQTNLFFENRDSSSSESSHDGSPSSFNRQMTASKMNGGEPRGHLETMNDASKLLLSSANEMNPVFGSALTHAKQRRPQRSPDNTLSMGCDPQFNPLSPLHLCTCHVCGLFGSLRCTQCKQIYYCSVDCQRKDWQKHSVVCKPVKHNADKVEENAKSLEEIKKKEKLLFISNNKAEEQGKKTMFSDLTTLGLKKNMKIEGMVTEFNNPSEFYIQLNSTEVLSNIRELSVKLKDFSGVNQEEYIPAKGEVVVAKYSLDQTWCRVLIKEVDILKKSALVLYIDYGNGENIPLNRIKRLHQDLAHFPPCAIKCCVAKVLSAKEQWNAKCKNTVAPFLIGKCCSLTIIDVLMDEMPYFAVDVVLPVSGKHLYEILLEMEHGLNSKGKSTNKENVAIGSTVEKLSIKEKKFDCKGLDHTGCQIPKVILLSVGDAFFGMVAHIQTPGDFFCQQMENGRKLSELQASLGEYCNKISATPDFVPAVGDLCCAQFTDSQWYRASVLSYVSEKTALVGYVDYGNFEVLQLTKLRPIIPKLMELPVQAIKCTLAGVKPISGIWSTESTSVMKKLVQNKVVNIRVRDKKEKTFVVELIDESMTPTINVAKCLLELGFAMEETTIISTVVETSTGTLQEISGQQLDKLDWSWVTLTAEQVVNVVVCVLYNPSEFYCQLLNSDGLNALKELNMSLAEYCQKTVTNVSKVKKGDLCCAYFSGDGRWYRALVKETSSFESFKVLFVDYGNCEEVTLDKVRQISSAFMKLPFQAIRCWLSGVRPINKEWTTEATATLQMCTAGKKLQARVVSLTTNGAEVELIDNSTGNPVMISEILINEQLALKKETLSNLSMLPDELATNYSQECKQWTTAELPVDETVSVHVLDVINPGLFYVVPTKMKVDPQRLHKLMTGLAGYCNSWSDHSFKPKVGEPCCARFTGDDNWYRAVILGIGASEVKVAYADYGNVEMLPFSRLLPIPVPYLELPFQILKCSLAGIKELDGKWCISATEKLKSLLLNECIIVTVKGVSKSIHAVTVQKNCENGILNVADQLVIENLARYSNSENQCAKNTKCCCTELRKQVTKLEQIICFLLKDRFGEDKLPEMIKPLEG
ncbi:tudor domain-containing protein 1 isoform X2 [Rhineura floridana]|uniref:tudor domain-containing protein 1 isoform X2 n=1 Tax=Rhineura floridana TaxID=261503 RepID=UPI002AC81B63|nr:tudor domain-containing protein 1 isoform X2 [Rhineura floridana]